MSSAEYPDGIPSEVCDHFERIASELLASGFDRYSADAVLHRIRWHERVEQGNRSFKCNDHWTAPLARWFGERHPESAAFFETREHRAAPVRAYVD
ncbi:hypothetical protein [Bradyrhizobium ivorense]|uniref:hypothetical protein n=1 Tax=Bradyrhizobium ivorense TaxID=2511166 RepID=UPI0010B1B091|nr:hypothetical protein [Bradyrhizobium ivorense]VIO73861.1 hypothetical protein CI41S_39700 [Bradyrhizobium ivorense]